MVVYLIVRPNTFTFSWARCLIAALALAAWTYWQLEWVMHSPGLHLAHCFWLLVATFLISLAALGCGGVKAMQFFRARPQ